MGDRLPLPRLRRPMSGKAAPFRMGPQSLEATPPSLRTGRAATLVLINHRKGRAFPLIGRQSRARRGSHVRGDALHHSRVPTVSPRSVYLFVLTGILGSTGTFCELLETKLTGHSTNLRFISTNLGAFLYQSGVFTRDKAQAYSPVMSDAHDLGFLVLGKLVELGDVGIC